MQNNPALDHPTAILHFKQLCADLYPKFGSPDCQRIAKAACEAAYAEAKKLKPEHAQALAGQGARKPKHKPCPCETCVSTRNKP